MITITYINGGRYKFKRRLMTMKSISEQQRGGNAICSLCDDYMYSSQLNYDVVYIEMAGSLNHLKNGWRTWIQKPYIAVQVVTVCLEKNRKSNLSYYHHIQCRSCGYCI